MTERSPTNVDASHVDTFCADRLPPPEQWPVLTDIEHYPEQLNAADYLLIHAKDPATANLPAFHCGDVTWSYAQLDDHVRRWATVLTNDHDIVAGNRILIRGFNSPSMAAAILAAFHIGAVAVPTMPLLRAAELETLADRSASTLLLTDHRLADEAKAMTTDPSSGRSVDVVTWGDGGVFDRAIEVATPSEAATPTRADEVAMLLFTSGTTGVPKAACHLHRDIAAICETVGTHTYGLSTNDVVTGTPPLAFAYGFGAFMAFPLRAGAATVLIERPSPTALIDAIETHRATVTFTAPTAYRALLGHLDGRDISSVRYGASAGETLPSATWQQFKDATGIDLLDGIGSTEMLHVFLSNHPTNIRPGATGVDVPGYENRVVNDDGTGVEPGHIGHLEVRGPTGCLYLDDERQQTYVRDGWNRTGDLYEVDEDGWFWYKSRADDLIVTSGYNVAGPEVENALLSHPDVGECAVIGIPDEERGQLIKAFVVVAADTTGDAAALQNHVKEKIAPYKYPRHIEFVDALPKTGTGKIQRFRLREQHGS